MLDLFILGASPAERRQWQIYNRYDRCCYDGIRSDLFAETTAKAAKNVGGGRFEVLIDETHARHKISRWAMEWIMRDLAELNAAGPGNTERRQ